MDDSQIIKLYFARSEQAIEETEKKYGAYCFHIAQNILDNREDAEESVSDTYLTAWRTIPPTVPLRFSAFLGKITRHIALDRWRRNYAAKRGAGETVLALEELEECISSRSDAEDLIRANDLRTAIGRFLDGLNEQERILFVSRYWYLRSVKYISEKTGFSESKVKTQLFRTRNKLREFLAEEDLL